MKEVTFTSVVYRKYKPAREQARATIREDAYSHVIEYEDWETLLTVLERQYPGLKYEIPDEIEVIVLDKNFKRVE